jgi:hypothetical protein
MAAEANKGTGDDQADSPIDELIREILNESRVSPESPARGRASAALLETAFASSLAGSRTSTIERLLLAEAFGSALAEALAPALAELLTPRLVKYLEQVMANDSPGRGPASAGRSSAPGRRAGG